MLQNYPAELARGQLFGLKNYCVINYPTPRLINSKFFFWGNNFGYYGSWGGEWGWGGIWGDAWREGVVECTGEEVTWGGSY